jgi:hypothetical protein
MKQSRPGTFLQFFHVNFVVTGHEGHCHEIREEDTTEEDQHVLGDPSPRGMAGSKKDGLDNETSASCFP